MSILVRNWVESLSNSVINKIKVLRVAGIELANYSLEGCYSNHFTTARLYVECNWDSISSTLHIQLCKDYISYRIVCCCCHGNNTPQKAKNTRILGSFHHDYYSIYNAVESSITEHKCILTSDSFYLPKKFYFNFIKI